MYFQGSIRLKFPINICVFKKKCHVDFEYNNIQFTFVPVHSNRLMKKGGGIGPLKPWQPPTFGKVPIPVSLRLKR